MNFILESLSTAVSLIATFDKEVYQAVWTSLYLSAASTIMASAVGVPSGLLLSAGKFPFKRLAIVLLNTLMALPTVVVGLVVYGIISRQGPLGELGLLFSPAAIVIGQSILALPIIASYTLSSINGADSRILPTAMTLGASPTQGYLILLSEVRFGIMAAVIAGFGRVVAEVGVAMMLGGNIRGYTRTMTTAIALETSKGEFAFGMALGIILMTVALAVNLLLNYFQERRG